MTRPDLANMIEAQARDYVVLEMARTQAIEAQDKELVEQMLVTAYLAGASAALALAQQAYRPRVGR